ncbi:hypothetical protein [Parasphingorhabdus cellanae]|uniref:Uncharacterized protein n=1 Tax=Parasphingorhabdus cellanae TaxID=2806553 RepID=A0ABX7T7Y1_9SPHN|nr:hypothetical protein [Parasphingorhabdus cellanae]QTD56053.1 hypothetical protein J4G78_00095 [Parasphingorhabdus cellanae]
MENMTDRVSPEETTAPAAGLFSGTIACAPSPTPTSQDGFLSEIERMPHFGIPSEESFVRNFLAGRGGFFVTKP